MSAFSSPLTRERDAKARSLASRSCPALGGRDLRQVGIGKRLLAMEYTKEPEQCPLETIKERERRRALLDLMERRWQFEEDERNVIATEARKLRRRQEHDRSARRREAQAQKEQRVWDMAVQWRQEQAASHQRERERNERKAREEEEQERAAAEMAAREKLRRVPVLCETCETTGRCPECDGRGTHPALFLSPAVDSKPAMRGHHALQFGSTFRGCETCFGCNQGIRGPLRPGLGTCPCCAGAGKFCTGWCNISFGARRNSFYGRASMARRGSTAGLQSTQTVSSAPSSRAEKEAAAAKRIPRVCRKCFGSIWPTLEEAQAVWNAGAPAANSPRTW